MHCRGVHCVLTNKDVLAYAAGIKTWLDEKAAAGANSEIVIFHLNTLFGTHWDQATLDWLMTKLQKVGRALMGGDRSQQVGGLMGGDRSQQVGGVSQHLHAL